MDVIRRGKEEEFEIRLAPPEDVKLILREGGRIVESEKAKKSVQIFNCRDNKEVF
jgi:hypothetical protein